MLRKHLSAGLTVCLLASVPGLAGGNRAADPPSLAVLRAVVQPLLEGLELTEQQQSRAEAVMSEEGWEATVKAFKAKREGEIFRTTHTKMNGLVPTIMKPGMMAANARKTMADRKARRAGPPSARELEARRRNMKAQMRGKLNPQLMSNLRKLAAQRIQEILADEKAMVRVLGEKLSTVVLTAQQQPGFQKALSDAGYPGSLIHGADPVLDGRMEKMVKKVTDKELGAVNSGR